MAPRRHRCVRASLLLGAALASACSSTRPAYFAAHLTEAYVCGRWLPPLVDGVTTRAQVLQALGRPSRQYESGRIAAYRLVVGAPAVDESAYRTQVMLEHFEQLNLVFTREMEAFTPLVITDGRDDEQVKRIITAAGEFHLVFVYDGASVVARHAIHRVRP